MIIITISIIEPILFTSFTLGYNREVIIMTDRDSYVSSGWFLDNYDARDSNYGGRDWFFIGNSFGLKESYFHFNLTIIPSDAKILTAKIHFYLYSVEETLDIQACQTSCDWEEYSITWDDKPTHGVNISALKVPANGNYQIDVSEYLTGKEISICLYTLKPHKKCDCQGYTREATKTQDEVPHLLISYEIPNKFDILFNTLLTIILIAIIISTSNLFLIIRKKKKQRKEFEEKEFEEECASSPPQELTTSQHIREVQPREIYCPHCGTKTLSTNQFCRECGSHLI